VTTIQWQHVAGIARQKRISLYCKHVESRPSWRALQAFVIGILGHLTCDDCVSDVSASCRWVVVNNYIPLTACGTCRCTLITKTCDTKIIWRRKVIRSDYSELTLQNPAAVDVATLTAPVQTVIKYDNECWRNHYGSNVNAWTEGIDDIVTTFAMFSATILYTKAYYIPTSSVVNLHCNLFTSVNSCNQSLVMSINPTDNTKYPPFTVHKWWPVRSARGTHAKATNWPLSTATHYLPRFAVSEVP